MIDEVNTGYKVSNISRDADGVIVRILTDSLDGSWMKDDLSIKLATMSYLLYDDRNR